jgi:methyl-accepting chemotaxis protein
MNSLRSLSIGKRLSLGFAAILGLSLAITAIGVWRLMEVASTTRHMMEQPIAKERMISDWFGVVDSGIRRTTAIVHGDDPKLAAAFAREAKGGAAQAVDLQARIAPLIGSAQESQLYQQIGQQRERYLATRVEVLEQMANGRQAQARQAFEASFVPAATAYEDLMHALLRLERSQINETALRIDRIALDSRTLLLALAAAILAASAALAWRLTAGITRPLGDAVKLAQRVATGDLSADAAVASGDETGRLLDALNAMSGSLRTIVSEVRGGTEQIATASSQIASGNLDLSRRTEAQASSLEQAAAMMKELTETVRNNASHASHASGLAASAAEIAQRGGRMVGDAVSRMAAIDQASQAIVEIISVIEAIALQTNILALNAAVEAARAGEHGRGFAVVAAEVRTLAQRTSTAAKQVQVLITDSAREVGHGSRLVADAGATIQQVVASVQQVSGLVQQISAASAEQRDGIEQVHQAVGQIDQITQQNAALVEEAAAAAASMQESAAGLARLVSVFKLAPAAVRSDSRGSRVPPPRLLAQLAGSAAAS